MRKLIAFGTAFALLGMATIAQAQEKDEARDILNKAIKAMGLEKDRELPKGLRVKTKGSIDPGGMNLAMAQQITVALPNKVKEVVEITVAGNKVTVTTVFDGEKGAFEVMGMVKKFDDKMTAELKELANLTAISQLTPLLDKKYKLSLVGEVKVDDKPAIGIRVSGKGFRDVNLFFDKKTNTLVKIERQAVDPMSGNEVQEERIFKEYQDVDGRKVPKTGVVLRDGKVFVEVEVLEYARLDQVDPAEFTVPKE